MIECFDGGTHLAARGGTLRLALAGDAVLEASVGGERQRLGSWRTLCLDDGDTLRVTGVERGRIVVIAVEGLSLPRVLGSASTYARAALGGLDGRALSAGVRLAVAAASTRAQQMLGKPPPPSSGPIRAIAGPQADHFDADTRAAFCHNDYRVSAEADRMGVRLDGPALVHAGAREIVSDATVPGSIQVPGNGLPIVLLADAQTAGGYPKIGTVIGADLARVAAARPGQVLRFTWVSAEDGERLAREHEAATRALLASIRPLLAGGIDEAALYAANLVSGAVDAMSGEHRATVGVLGEPRVPPTRNGHRRRPD